MLKYIVKRLLWIIPVLIGVTIIVFTILYFSPGDPAYLALGDNATPEAVEAYRVEMGINGTYWERLGRTLGGLLKGDLGLSYRSRTPVLNELLVRFKVTFNISAWSIVLGIILGIFFGIISALKQNTLWDSLSTGCALFGISMPMFWQGLMLILVFSVWLGWLPIGLSVPIGAEAAAVTLADRLRHAILPALTLSITGVANIALHTREKVADVMESDYVLFARARGESTGSIVLRHGLRNIALPALTLQFASISEIIGGSVVVEQVFSYPGLGQAAVTAGLGSDLPLLLGITVVTSALVFGGNLAADLLYGAVDPRIRRGAARE